MTSEPAAGSVPPVYDASALKAVAELHGEATRAEYEKNGVVCLRGVFSQEWVTYLAEVRAAQSSTPASKFQTNIEEFAFNLNLVS